MQSCYLFDCGSPAKPLCKFTAHGFFTSSVLKMTQHSYELSQWGKQVQQERANTERQSDISPTTPVSVDKTLFSTSPILPTNGSQQTRKGLSLIIFNKIILLKVHAYFVSLVICIKPLLMILRQIPEYLFYLLSPNIFTLTNAF